MKEAKKQISSFDEFHSKFKPGVLIFFEETLFIVFIPYPIGTAIRYPFSKSFYVEFFSPSRNFKKELFVFETLQFIRGDYLDLKFLTF